MKTCSKCSKPDGEVTFSRSTWKVCDSCIRAYKAAHYLQNKEKYNKANKANYEANREHYGNLAAQRYQENREKFCARQQARKLANPELKKQRDADYYARNSIRIKAQVAARKARPLPPLQAIVDALRLACTDCKLEFPADLMDFDHLGDKTNNVASLVSNLASIEEILREIRKCEPVCANCHRIRTVSRTGKWQYGPWSVAPIIDQHKNKPCLDCNKVFPAECMDFDHRDPTTKKFNLGYARASMTKRRLQEVLDEIAKCDLVCACCHRVRTRKQRQQKKEVA